MKEIPTGLEAEDEIETSIMRSGRFREILEKYCNMQVNLGGDNVKAVILTTKRYEQETIRLLMKDIREGNLKD